MDLQRNQPQQSANRHYDEVPALHHAGVMQPSLASKILVMLLIVVSVLVIGLIGTQLFAGANSNVTVKSKQYQALFLTNGQVYFCHLSQVDSGYVRCKDIYYLQVQQAVQPPKDQSTNQQPQVSLAKLGGELHGPEDVMYVSRQQVLFWENLKDDGKVVKAISDYQSGKK
jgi:hypothetical protein